MNAAVSTIARVTNPAGTIARRVELAYNPADPYAVTLHVDDRAWVFARDLLADGTRRRVGECAVQVWPDDDRVLVVLTGRVGWALLSLDAADVEFFLDLTYAAVARGQERIDVDGWLAAELGGAR